MPGLILDRRSREVYYMPKFEKPRRQVALMRDYAQCDDSGDGTAAILRLSKAGNRLRQGCHGRRAWLWHPAVIRIVRLSQWFHDRTQGQNQARIRTRHDRRSGPQHRPRIWRYLRKPG